MDGWIHEALGHLDTHLFVCLPAARFECAQLAMTRTHLYLQSNQIFINHHQHGRTQHFAIEVKSNPLAFDGANAVLLLLLFGGHEHVCEFIHGRSKWFLS